MKKTFLLIIIFLLTLDVYAQDINYHFLDSNFVEVLLKNSDKISYKERKKIYFYIEYALDENNYVNNFKVFYTEGAYPENTELPGQPLAFNKKSYISFSNPQLRKGKLCRYIEILPYKGALFSKGDEAGEDTTFFTKISQDKFYPNGNLMGDRIYYRPFKKSSNSDSLKIMDESFGLQKAGKMNSRYQGIKNKELRYYKLDGSLSYTEFYEDNLLMKLIINLDNPEEERILFYNDNAITHIIDYRNGNMLAKYNYENGNHNKNLDEYFSVSGIKLFNFNNTITENNVKKYLDSRGNLHPLEGIYTVTSKANTPLSYKIAVLLDRDDKLFAYLIEWYCYNAEAWKIGEVKASFEEIALEGFYKVTWLDDYKKQEVNDVIEDKTSGALITFGNYNMIKLYPKYSKRMPSTSSKKTDDWKSNGSGLVISKSGYIVTNHHVTENASSIEVEFKYKNNIVSFNARVIKEDILNDLAIIKIDDSRFSGFSSIPYTYKLGNADVGTKIYAYGYPMALEIMGKEVKITDGIISSRTGYQGDITKYQISAPIQGGNSGGPLFDEYANLIGINSSGLKKYLSDNVGYSIKANYLMNLIDVLPEEIKLPSSSKLANQPLIEQIKLLSDYVVLIKIK